MTKFSLFCDGTEISNVGAGRHSNMAADGHSNTVAVGNNKSILWLEIRIAVLLFVCSSPFA